MKQHVPPMEVIRVGARLVPYEEYRKSNPLSAEQIAANRLYCLKKFIWKN